MAKIDDQTDPVKSGNTTAPLGRPPFKWPLHPGLLGDLALSSEGINCHSSHGRHAGFTARLKAETELGLNSTLTDAFSLHAHRLCSGQNARDVGPGAFEMNAGLS